MKKHGDILCFGTWYGESDRPCLALVPARAVISHERVTPCIVPLDTAWKWTEELGDIRDCAATCIQFAHALGLNPHDKASVLLLLTVIRDHIGDLLSMPIKPTENLVVADAIINTGGKIEHKEIIQKV